MLKFVNLILSRSTGQEKIDKSDSWFYKPNTLKFGNLTVGQPTGQWKNREIWQSKTERNSEKLVTDWTR